MTKPNDGGPDRDRDDAMGEACRRHVHGLIRPLWSDMTDDQRSGWIVAGQKQRRIMESCGLAITIAASEADNG